jgi:regulator of RNase E activity RraA
MTEAIRQEIIRKIRRNRISSTQVSDCLEKSGVVENVRALNPGHHRIGPVFWTYAYNESNWELHEQIREAPEDSVVLTEAFACGRRALYGELVSKYLILYRQVAAAVVCGFVRDAANLMKERWPIWLEGVTPIGCFNVRNTKPLDPHLVNERRDFYDSAIAVCDDTGVVVISKAHITPAFLDKLDWIEEQEDIWFDCIDRRKLDTYETVCLRLYEGTGQDHGRTGPARGTSASGEGKGR